MIIVSIQFFYYLGEGLRSGWVYFGINLLNRANQGPFIRSSGTIPIHDANRNKTPRFFFLLKGKSCVNESVNLPDFFIECVAKFLKKVEKILDRSICLCACYLIVSRQRKTFWAAPGCGNGRKSMQPPPQRMISHLRRHIKIPFRKFKCAIKLNLHLLRHLQQRFSKMCNFYNRDTGNPTRLNRVAP